MQVYYKGIIFIFKFEMVDKTLKPGFPRRCLIAQFPYLQTKVFKRWQLNINDGY